MPAAETGGGNDDKSDALANSEELGKETNKDLCLCAARRGGGVGTTS